MDELIRQADVTTATMLAFLRLSAFFVVAPIPGKMAPVLARILLAGGLAWSIHLDPSAVTTQASWAAVFTEVAFGLMAGMLVAFVLQAFTFAGEAAGQQMGLATPGFASPELSMQLTIMGSAFTFITLGVFAASDGPLRMFGAMERWFALLPPGVGARGMDIVQIVSESGRDLFANALHAAAPLITAVFGAQLILAVLARSVPTLNLFVEGPALTISSGIVGILASIHTLVPLVDRNFDTRFEQIGRWLIR